MLANIQTVDDISSGYSSGELAHAGQSAKLQAREALVRTGSIGSSKLKPTRITRSTAPKKSTEVNTIFSYYFFCVCHREVSYSFSEQLA